MPPKFFLAFHQQKFCILRKERNRCCIDHLGSFSSDVKPLDIAEGRKGQIVTGLKSSEVILRHLTLKLKTKREILSALPFQVENFLPYPLHDLILLPAIDVQKDFSEISLLATSTHLVSKHLEQDLDPDIVSCIPLALFRYAQYTFTDVNSFFLYHSETFIAVEEGKLQAFQAVTKENFNRILTLMQKKFPNIPAEVIQDGNHWEFAIVIGLALDAALGDMRSAQFRVLKNISKKSIKKQRNQWICFFSLCFTFILITGLFGKAHLKKREQVILETLGFKKNSSLSQTVTELEQSFSKQKKEVIAVSTLPKLSEILTWLSTHPKLSEDCSITRLRYQLLKTPRLGTAIKTQSAKVELELTTQNPKIAREFHEALLKDKEFVDQKNDIRWNADHGLYRASFYIKPGKLQ